MFTRLTLSSSLSPSRSYSTSIGPNKAIIDLLTRCILFFLENIRRTIFILVCLGLNEEDSSPTRNAYKIRSYQVALAAIHQHDKPIHSGKEATKVRLQYP